MKKDRNSFFSQYGVSSYNSAPFMMQPQQMPYDNNMIPNFYNNQTDNNIEAKINRLERQVSMLEERVQKIESTLTSVATNNDYNFANSMYMV